MITALAYRLALGIALWALAVAGAAAQGGATSPAPPAPAQPTAQNSGAPLPAGDVTSAAINAFIDALPKDAISDLPIRVFDAGASRIGVYGVFRPRSLPGDAILHETQTTEVYYMLEGAGTLVTGGTIAGLKPPPPGRAAGPRGERIEGGVTRRVVKGDVVVIPGRTPHWWSSLEGDIRYLIIRADPVSRIPLR